MLTRRKVYRAFRQFDHLSDEEGDRLIRLFWLTTDWYWIVAPMLACIGMFLILAAMAGWVSVRWLGYDYAEYEEALVITGSALVCGIAGGGIAWLIARDIVTVLGLRRQLNRASCRCGQSLIGLPIRSVTLGPPEPGDARVRCPECGRVIILTESGLTPRDLIPWEQRTVPKELGQHRRSGRH